MHAYLYPHEYVRWSRRGTSQKLHKECHEFSSFEVFMKWLMEKESHTKSLRLLFKQFFFAHAVYINQ